MCSKVVRVVSFLFLSLIVQGTATANLIRSDAGQHGGVFKFLLNGIYSDASGEQWQYMGFYRLGDGELKVNDPTVLSGVGAASLLTGIDESLLATSAFSFKFGASTLDSAFTAGVPLVNFSAWYDFYDTGNISIASQDFLNGGLDDKYNENGDASAYVKDRAPRSSQIFPILGFDGYSNYVFKKVAVAEPSILLLFALSAFGVFFRRKSIS